MKHISLLFAIALLAAISFTAARWCFERRLHALLRRRRSASQYRAPRSGFAHAWTGATRHRMASLAARVDDSFRDARRLVAQRSCGRDSVGRFVSCWRARFFSRPHAESTRLCAAAAVVGLVFALNPNMLYLQSTPMTEALFAASLAAMLWATLWFRDSQSVVGGSRRRRRIECRVAHALRRLVSDSLRRAVLAVRREAEVARDSVRGARRAGTAGLARAQSVLLQQRARVLQRAVVGGGDLRPPARAGNAAVSWRSRLAQRR